MTDSLNLTLSAPPEIFEDYDEECPVPFAEHVNIRFGLVVVVGSVLCVMSFLQNLLVFVSFVTNVKHRQSQYIYLIMLAIYDCGIAVSYIMLMVVSVLIDYYKKVIFLRLWFSYVVPTLTITHVAMSASAFTLVAMASESYARTLHPKALPYMQRYRPAIATSAVVFAILLKITMWAEFVVTYKDACANTLAEWEIGVSELSMWYPYEVFKFWGRNTLTVFLPFILLAYFNFRIVQVLKRRSAFAPLFVHTANHVKRRVRDATRLLVLLVCTYLIANLLMVVVSAWEYVDRNSLANHFHLLYVYATDFVSLATLVSGVLRLPIYCYTTKEVRQELRNTVCRLFGSGAMCGTTCVSVDKKGKHHSSDNTLGNVELLSMMVASRCNSPSNGTMRLNQSFSVANNPSDVQIVDEWQTPPKSKFLLAAPHNGSSGQPSMIFINERSGNQGVIVGNSLDGSIKLNVEANGFCGDDGKTTIDTSGIGEPFVIRKITKKNKRPKTKSQSTVIPPPPRIVQMYTAPKMENDNKTNGHISVKMQKPRNAKSLTPFDVPVWGQEKLI